MGAGLKGERVRKGLSQRQLAERAGISSRMVAFIEAGERVPSPVVGYRIARALGWNLGMMWYHLYSKAVNDAVDKPVDNSK